MAFLVLDAPLGVSWSMLEPILRPQGVLGNDLGTLLDYLGPILELLEPILALFEALFASSWLSWVSLEVPSLDAQEQAKSKPSTS